MVISGGDETLAKDIAMHVAAFNPLCLSESDIDPQILEREKAIYMVQAEESGKPQEIMEKMIEGKLKRFLSEVSLLSQNFVKDPEVTIQNLLDSNNAKIELLGINKNLILKHGAVSKEVALSMAKNLHRLTRSHICASITGIAGPSGGSKQKPVGTVYFLSLIHISEPRDRTRSRMPSSA